MSDAASILANLSLTNIISSLLSIEKLVTGTAYLIGISFVIKALYSLKSYGEAKSQMSNHGSMKEPAVYMFVGGMFIYFPTGFEVLMNTTFGYSQVLAYAPISSNNTIINTLFGQGSPFGYTLALIVQVVGVIAFVRGWILIARSASQGQPPGGVGQGLMHVSGGILAMNIIGTIRVIYNTLFGVY